MIRLIVILEIGKMIEMYDDLHSTMIRLIGQDVITAIDCFFDIYIPQ